MYIMLRFEILFCSFRDEDYKVSQKHEDPIKLIES